GRIELVTPRQRELLKEIAAAPVPNLKEVIQATYNLRGISAEKYNALASGRKDAAELGVAVPEVYQKYLELGRFRVSLLMNSGRTGDKSLAGLNDFMMELQAPGTGAAQQMRERRNAQQANADIK